MDLELLDIGTNTMKAWRVVAGLIARAFFYWLKRQLAKLQTHLDSLTVLTSCASALILVAARLVTRLFRLIWNELEHWDQQWLALIMGLWGPFRLISGIFDWLEQILGIWVTLGNLDWLKGQSKDQRNGQKGNSNQCVTRRGFRMTGERGNHSCLWPASLQKLWV